MKTSKFVGLASALTMLASLAAMPASAAHINAYSVSYETLTEAIETDAGVTVPAGAVAVTMSVERNRGFDADTITLNIEQGYTVLTDTEGHPLVTKETILSNALIATAINGNTLCVTTSVENTCTVSGELFTVYVEPNENASIGFANINNVDFAVDFEEISGGIVNPGGNAQINTVWIQDENGNIHPAYYGGDSNNDNHVNAMDAARIMNALSNAGTDELTVNINNITTYFPQVASIHQPDADDNGKIEHKTSDLTNSDAQIILQYAADTGAGNIYSGNGAGIVGQLILVNN